eukprot:3208132-Pyramimonas_sp.AAC.1
MVFGNAPHVPRRGSAEQAVDGREKAHLMLQRRDGRAANRRLEGYVEPRALGHYVRDVVFAAGTPERTCSVMTVSLHAPSRRPGAKPRLRCSDPHAWSHGQEALLVGAPVKGVRGAGGRRKPCGDALPELCYR